MENVLPAVQPNDPLPYLPGTFATYGRVPGDILKPRLQHLVPQRKTRNSQHRNHGIPAQRNRTREGRRR